MRSIIPVLLLTLGLSACTSEVPNEPPKRAPVVEPEQDLPGFAGKPSNEILAKAGQAMEKVRTYHFRGSLEREGERTSVQLYLFPDEGCKGKLVREGYRTDIIVFLPDGAYSRKEGKRWQLHKPGSSPYSAYCNAGDLMGALVNQKDVAGLEGKKNLSSDKKYVQVQYGTLGEVWVRTKAPHHVHRIVGPGMDLTFYKFNTFEPIESPPNPVIRQSKPSASMGDSVR